MAGGAQTGRDGTGRDGTRRANLPWDGGDSAEGNLPSAARFFRFDYRDVNEELIAN